MEIPKSKIPAVDGYTEPVITEETKSLTFYELGGERFLKKSAAKSASKRLDENPADVKEIKESVPVFIVEDELFLDREKAEKRLKSLLKKHRDRVREAARMLGVKSASQAAKLEPINWLISNYKLETFKDQEFAYAFYGVSSEAYYPVIWSHYKWSWMKKLNDQGVPVEYWDIDEKRMPWVEDNSNFSEKLSKLDDLISYRTAEAIYKVARENADTDYDGNIISVLPLQWVANMVDHNLIDDEIKDIIDEFDKVENGTTLDIKTLQGRVQYWFVSDKKNLNPFKKF